MSDYLYSARHNIQDAYDSWNETGKITNQAKREDLR